MLILVNKTINRGDAYVEEAPSLLVQSFNFTFLTL